MFEIASIGKSNGGLDIPLLKITSTPTKYSLRSDEKPIIFIMGR